MYHVKKKKKKKKKDGNLQEQTYLKGMNKRAEEAIVRLLCFPQGSYN